MKVFGIGLPRTGTTTLLYACRELGLRGTTYNATAFFKSLEAGNNRQATDRFFRFVKRYSIFQDLPFPMVYRSLAEKYPNARFILTVRKDEETWYKSLWNNAQDKEHVLHILYLRECVYGHKMPNSENWKDFIKKYMDHNHAVRQFFSQHPELHFKELCWEKGDGWGQLCSFLKKPIPTILFPHKNSSAR